MARRRTRARGDSVSDRQASLPLDLELVAPRLDNIEVEAQEPDRQVGLLADDTLGLVMLGEASDVGLAARPLSGFDKFDVPGDGRILIPSLGGTRSRGSFRGSTPRSAITAPRR